uniref:Uncharacterized protein n=1 Tax=Timema monikensis TaxID=170555 RepID=A0A7R9E756_9NEOP|nr:unnamed protein product [Timema monikensis]
MKADRVPVVSYSVQEMYSLGLRGAMSFALAIRNTVSEARQAMLTTTSLIVIITVIVQGGATMQLLTWFKIPVGVEEEVELLPYTGIRSNVESTTPREISGSTTSSNEKALLARLWGDFDSRYMKPFLTHTRPTLLETLPVCCNSLARLLTTTEQMTHLANALVVLSPTAEDGEIEVRISVGSPLNRGSEGNVGSQAHIIDILRAAAMYCVLWGGSEGYVDSAGNMEIVQAADESVELK